MSDTVRIERIFALGALLTLTAGTILILSPFLSAILLAAVLTVSTWPVHVALTRLLKGRRTLSATILTTLFALIILGPLAYLVTTLGHQTAEFSDAARKIFEEGLPAAPDWTKGLPIIGDRLAERWDSFSVTGREAFLRLRPYVSTFLEGLLAFGAGFGRALFDLTVALIVTFIFLKDGATLAQKLESVMSRLAGTRASGLIQTAALTSRGVVYGILGTALVQSVLAWIGFSIVGVSSAALLGFFTFFLSLIPIGPPLIWLPISIWLFNDGETIKAVFLIVWGILVVSGADNFVKPYLISRGARLPVVLIFLGVMGGALEWGMQGIFLGPTILAVSYSLLKEWMVPTAVPTQNTAEVAPSVEMSPVADTAKDETFTA